MKVLLFVVNLLIFFVSGLFFVDDILIAKALMTFLGCLIILTCKHVLDPLWRRVAHP